MFRGMLMDLIKSPSFWILFVAGQILLNVTGAPLFLFFIHGAIIPWINDSMDMALFGRSWKRSW